MRDRETTVVVSGGAEATGGEGMTRPGRSAPRPAGTLRRGPQADAAGGLVQGGMAVGTERCGSQSQPDILWGSDGLMATPSMVTACLAVPVYSLP